MSLYFLSSRAYRNFTGRDKITTDFNGSLGRDVHSMYKSKFFSEKKKEKKEVFFFCHLRLTFPGTVRSSIEYLNIDYLGGRANGNFQSVLLAAYKHADGKKIDGRRVLVDVERARTVKGWLPRRLGGGLGGTRRGGPDVNIKHSGREDNERERERYRLERERENSGRLDRDR